MLIRHRDTRAFLEHVSFTFGIEGISRACSHQACKTQNSVIFTEKPAPM
ncbi:FAD-dependent thymidylate synthase [Ruminococcus sp. HUN007]